MRLETPPLVLDAELVARFRELREHWHGSARERGKP
jgi:hypothetical protein